ncbi:hypothetical protein ACFE04_027146 [Oxalis oulophora]
MATDSITTNASIASAPKDFAKKKRGNRTAKLKQCKLDARREQWLSQVSVKNKGICEKKMDERNLEMTPRREKIDVSIETELFSLSASNSPTSILLSGSESGTNFTGSSSNSSSSGGFCSGNITEDEKDEERVDDDDTLDDWEAVADALAAIDDHQNNHEEKHDCPVSPEHKSDEQYPQSGQMMSECTGTVTRTQAWRLDDEFRPQSLPNLSKQHTFPDRGRAWVCKATLNAPTSCPICCEDLDMTDSSFLPCMCGFHLCLFCYKRILDEDGRCPGCRKTYDLDLLQSEVHVVGGSVAFRLARSCSMFERS